MDRIAWQTIAHYGCFDSDASGTISFDELKNVFTANVGPDAIPFNFDWCVEILR